MATKAQRHEGTQRKKRKNLVHLRAIVVFFKK